MGSIRPELILMISYIFIHIVVYELSEDEFVDSPNTNEERHDEHETNLERDKNGKNVKLFSAKPPSTSFGKGITFDSWFCYYAKPIIIIFTVMSIFN